MKSFRICEFFKISSICESQQFIYVLFIIIYLVYTENFQFKIKFFHLNQNNNKKKKVIREVWVFFFKLK